MEHNVLWENYGNWMLTLIGFQKRGYSNLMRQLHHIEFTWNILMDENRAMDGMKYRKEYLAGFGGNVTDFQVDFMKKQPCSVLEMLIGLAIRCDCEYIGDPKNPRPDLLFWEICCNLGLNAFKNRGFSNEKSEQLTEKVNNWLLKNYRSNGEGSIFPVKNPAKDHRNIEIWSQMMEYLTEKLASK